jgi:hypothetical protein
LYIGFGIINKLNIFAGKNQIALAPSRSIRSEKRPNYQNI